MFKELDNRFLENLKDEHGISTEEIQSQMEDMEMGLAQAFDVNAHIEIVMDIAGRNFLESVRDYVENNDIEFSVDDYLEQDFSIYTNCLDSSYDCELNELDITDTSDESVIAFLELVGVIVED